VRIVATRRYERQARKLLTAEERTLAELEIASDPGAWPVIPGTGGARKARARRGGKGKSGGARVVYFVMTARGLLILLYVYAKAEKEDLSDAEKKDLREIVKAVQAEG
jgi:hypothetical protein